MEEIEPKGSCFATEEGTNPLPFTDKSATLSQANSKLLKKQRNLKQTTSSTKVEEGSKPRDSGSIEQDADVVIFIYRDEYYHKRDEWELQHPDKAYPEGIADIIIAKHRNGPIGDINLHFVPKLARFENIAAQEPSLL